MEKHHVSPPFVRIGLERFPNIEKANPRKYCCDLVSVVTEIFFGEMLLGMNRDLYCGKGRGLFVF